MKNIADIGGQRSIPIDNLGNVIGRKLMKILSNNYFCEFGILLTLIDI